MNADRWKQIKALPASTPHLIHVSKDLITVPVPGTTIQRTIVTPGPGLTFKAGRNQRKRERNK